MPTFTYILKQISDLTSQLIETGLIDDQNFPKENREHGAREVSFPGSNHVSRAMKNIPYVEIYDHFNSERAYNFKLADGALVQMMYCYKKNKLTRHRLAFFPSPHLEEFQNSPTVYLEDEIYADIVAKNIVPSPIRFDFDNRCEVTEVLNHPSSHLTIGQYKNCRIPVSSPVIPYHFVDFILRNFYHTAHNKFSDDISVHPKKSFLKTIHSLEKNVVHMQAPDLS